MIPKEEVRSPLPLREILDKMYQNSYVVVKELLNDFSLRRKKINYIVQGGIDFLEAKYRESY